MTREEIRAAIVGALQRVAPELNAAELQDDQRLRDQIDLDSMDMLNVMIGLSERLGIDVPEGDYSRMATLDEAVRYVEQRLETRARTGPTMS